MTKKSKQILIVCGLVVLISTGIIFYYFQNKEQDYSYLEITNESSEQANIIEEKIEQIIVHITGQVVNQGIVKLQSGARIVDAIEAAGGVTQEADLSKINLAYVLEDGIKVYVPSINDEQEEYITENSGENTSTNNTEKKLMININTATMQDLQKLPGIGESIANRILNYRKENGKFNSIEDIKKVSGIGDSKFSNIKQYICIK